MQHLNDLLLLLLPLTLSLSPGYYLLRTNYLCWCAAIGPELPSSLFSSTGSFISWRNAGAFWTYVPPQASCICSSALY